jgi:flagellar protein FliS
MGTENTDRYLEIKVKTASPGQLVNMLFDGAIRFSKQAKDEMVRGDLAKSNAAIQRAQDIVEELNISLDTQKGGEIAANLRKIYLYLSEQLVEANIKKDAKVLDNVTELLKSLRDTWKEVMQKTTGGRQYVQTSRATDSSFNIAVE